MTMSKTITPLVSVVIPTYNHAHFLGRAIQSVLDQTYKNWEAIVIDNHSTDNTDEVLQKFTDERIRALKIHNNGVIAASRNMGIQASRGEWIAFLDSDDWWVSDKLTVCFEHINEHVDILYHDLQIVSDYHISSQEKKIMTSRQLKSPVFMDLLVNANLLANSSVVVRKRLLTQVGGINENPQMVASEDYNTWLRIARITEAFLYLPENLGFYMVHAKGVSKRDMTLPWKCAIQDYIDLLSSEQRNTFYCTTAYQSGRYQYSQGDYNRAIENFSYCISRADVNLRMRSVCKICVILLKKVSKKIINKSI